jgi:hypothetical protein
MEYRLIRTLSCYSNKDERLVFDVQLNGFKLKKFQEEFCVNKDNPMYDCFPISVKNIPFLNSYLPTEVGINWDFINYSYVLEVVDN